MRRAAPWRTHRGPRSRESARSAPCPRGPRATCGSARRPPSAGGARPAQKADRPPHSRRALPASIQPPSASSASVGERLAAAQFRMPAAGDQLLGLHEELDLADAAAAELDVVALDRDLAVAAIGVDLPLHRVHVGDRGEVEILAPDEGREFARGSFRRPRYRRRRRAP